jgi:hypothetical protein
MLKVALCFSDYCKFEIENECLRYRTQKGIEKDVKPSEVWCPDCGHALYWQRLEGFKTYEDWYRKNCRGIRRF